MYHRFLKSTMKKSISKLREDQGLYHQGEEIIKPSNEVNHIGSPVGLVVLSPAEGVYGIKLLRIRATVIGNTEWRYGRSVALRVAIWK